MEMFDAMTCTTTSAVTEPETSPPPPPSEGCSPIASAPSARSRDRASIHARLMRCFPRALSSTTARSTTVIVVSPFGVQDHVVFVREQMPGSVLEVTRRPAGTESLIERVAVRSGIVVTVIVKASASAGAATGRSTVIVAANFGIGPREAEADGDRAARMRVRTRAARATPKARDGRTLVGEILVRI